MTSLAESRRSQLFPRLSPSQLDIARRFASSEAQTFAPGDLVFAAGARNTPAFLVLSGAMEITGGDGIGHQAIITTHHAGEMSGEVSQLAGGPALAQGRAGAEGVRVLPFDAPHLRALIIGSAEIGELLMRAFILRRTALISEGGAGSVIVGRRGSSIVSRIEGFLARNGYPYTIVDPEAADIVVRLGIAEHDLPVVVCPNGEVLRRPSESDIAACLGITPVLDPTKLYDLAVVGAGPAGLATAVYAASEGLSVLVLDARAFGGQAGASARIENYLGFPTGITGHALMARAFNQAQKFGAEIASPVSVVRLECGGVDRDPAEQFQLHLEDGTIMRMRSVVIASGARYRRPEIANLSDFDGAGVSYWATPIEAKMCAGAEVALIGAGNSAGQAVAFLAPQVAKLHLVVRGDGLEASMSQYLIDRIRALPNVVIHARSEVTTLEGNADSGLAGATFRNRDTGAVWSAPIVHLFLFIGADPNTDWLADCGVDLDGKGFVATGERNGNAAAPLATSVPGVFAIGDVRAGSTKRVAAAVGEGAAAVAAVHGYLAQLGSDRGSDRSTTTA